jgi:glycosyltransferase involved in cell wall biosynthesis/transposase-like protein
MPPIGERNHWSEFKARAAIAAVRGDRTPDELAARFGVSVREIESWKQELIERASEVFGLAQLKRGQGEKVTSDLSQRRSIADEEFERIQRALDESDREIARLRAVFADNKIEPARLSIEIARRDGRIAALDAEVVDRDARINALNAEVADRDARIAALGADVTAANALIGEIISSRSWRLTRPFREFLGYAKATVKRFRRALNAAEIGSSHHRQAEHSIPAVLSAHQGLEAAVPEQLPVATPAEPLPDVALDERNAGPLACIAENQTDNVAATVARSPEEPFDPDFYIENYPDVKSYHPGPLAHFLTHGKAEGRVGTLPPFENAGEFASLDPLRETALLVSHEASRTGAPILCLNLVRRLKDRYNIVVLLLKGGAIANEFRESANVVVGPLAKADSEVLVTLNVAQLLERCSVKFAIVNSIVSRLVLPELARRFVPSVTLIHEFASYTRPRTAITDTLFWTSDAIFPAEVVRECALAALPELASRPGTILHQGRCSLKRRLASPAMQAEVARVKSSLRPHGWPDDTIVVLGVGYVQIRKGVDLFVACAARVLRAVGKRPCRFIWIGNGYEPETDNAYSSYLEDQVIRAELADRFAFVTETSEIDVAYAAADLLVISSRLDPLPNVAIDAMEVGLPLVCFERTTGIAEILRENGLAAECVAPYLDVEELATRVIALIDSSSLRRNLGERLKEISARVFDMASYVAQVEATAINSFQQAKREAEDSATIAESGLVDLDFLAVPGDRPPKMDVAVREFVRAWETGLRLRKPVAGFHPGIYADLRADKGVRSNPFADYIRSGAPDGPWRIEVIRQSSDWKVAPDAARVLLHLHVDHPGCIGDVLARLARNTIQPDIVVSVSSEESGAEVARILDSEWPRRCRVGLVAQDADGLEAFLGALDEMDIGKYAFIGHLETGFGNEAEEHGGDEQLHNFVLENMLGGSSAMVDAVVGRLIADQSLGLVFPDDPNISGWDGSREHAVRIAAGLGVEKLPVRHLNFPGAGVFWARTDAMRPLVRTRWVTDYIRSAVGERSLCIQALRRLLPAVVGHAGFGMAVTNVPGVSRGLPDGVS